MMKIFLSLLFVLLSVPAFAQGIYLPVATGTVTQANMKISAVDGTSFVDFSQERYVSDFTTSDLNGYTANNGTVASNIDSIAGQNDNIRYYANAKAGRHGIYRTMTVGKLYRVTFQYYIPSTNTNLKRVGIHRQSSDFGASLVDADMSVIGTTLDAWTTIEGTTLNNREVGVVSIFSGNSSFWTWTGANSVTDDLVYIRNITYAEVGLVHRTGNLLVVRDSSGQAIQGFIKAAGTGETFSDALAGWNFTSGWINHSNATINDANTFTTTSSGGIRKNDFLTELACYRVNFTANVSSGSVALLGYSISLATSGLTTPQPVVNFYNTTAPSFTSYYLRNNAAAITNVTSLKAEQVLTPSATGVTITSTKGGTTFNWAQKNTGFKYNDPSGYTYQIYKVLDAPVVDSDACTNANATINLTAGSAAWSCTGIDDAAYQDGKHVIAVYDTAGVAAFGYYKASGSGAVVNAKGGATQNWISIGAGFSTAGNYTRKVLYVGD